MSGSKRSLFGSRPLPVKSFPQYSRLEAFSGFLLFDLSFVRLLSPPLALGLTNQVAALLWQEGAGEGVTVSQGALKTVMDIKQSRRGGAKQ